MELHRLILRAALFFAAELLILFKNAKNLCTCQSLPVILDPVYYESLAMGRGLNHYETLQDVKTRIDCVRLCTTRRSWDRACQAFWFNREQKGCALFKNGARNDNPYLHLFLLQKKNRFYTISVGKETYSILFQMDRVPHHVASQRCRSLGGKLVEFDSLGKYLAVRTIQPDLYRSSVWVGANDRDVEGQWVTEDGGHAISNATWLWRAGKPDASTRKNCAFLHMFKGMGLGDAPCSNTFQFLCERAVL